MPRPRTDKNQPNKSNPKISLEKRILDSLTISQKYAILLLSSNNFESIKGKLWYQKELFLLAKNIENLEKLTDFEGDFIGPYSEIVDEESKQLELYEILESEDYEIKLTNFGRKIAKLLDKKIDQKEKEVIFELKSFLNDMTQDELLCFIYFTYPEMTKESIKFDKINLKKKEIALRLYKKGKISLGKASEIAEIPIENFINKLKAEGIKVYSD